MKWFKISELPPPKGKVINTKIEENGVSRNEQKLKLGTDNGLWWFPDGSMYVYYSPTHWSY